MDWQMQQQIFLTINGIINDAIIEILPFLILDMKDKYKKYKYLIYIAINIFDWFYYGYQVPTIISILTLIIMPYIITLTFFKDDLWKKLFISFFYLFITFGFDICGFIYLYVFLDGSAYDIYEKNQRYCTATTFNNLLYFIAVFLVVLLWKYFIDKKRNKYYVLYVPIALYQLVLTGVFIYYSRDYTETVMWLGLLSVIMSFSFDIIMFYFIRQLERKQTVEAEMKELSLSYQREFQMYKDIERQLQTLREQRHEFANQLQTVYAMIEQNAPAEHIKRYLADIEAFHGQD